ncbi:MAG TPA: ferredoxin--NADP reductase [Candidatus Acidoferrales bacterium]|nr:ferredoxin--NADP reductase [Candidatus Acidoferrales bacterium]
MSLAEDKFYRARITHRSDIAEDLWIIRLAPGGEFRFLPGQYATLGVETPAKLVERAYSIVSAPHENELEIFIELVPQGELTPLLYKLKSGDELAMRKIPKGRFTLDTKSGRKNHLLLSTVTGIAPFVSYIRSLAKDWREGKFKGEHHLYAINAASRSWEFGYREEIEKVAAAVPWLTYVATISRPWEDEKWTGETGRIEDLVRKYADSWGLDGSNTSAYLCGHPQMIDNSKGILRRRGFQKDAVREEVYWIPAKSGEA